jgi:hypothetical protein
MRVRIAAVAAVAALVAPAGPAAQAAPPAGRLVFSGSGHRYADVTIRSRIVLSLRNGTDAPDNVAATYGGAYAGIAVQDAAHHLLGGVVLVRGWTRPKTGTSPEYALGPTVLPPLSLTLNPGRYRLLLIADGAADVAIRTAGGSLRVTAGRAATGIVAQRTEVATTGPARQVSAGTSRLDVTQSPQGLLVVGLFSAVRVGVAQVASYCIRAQSDSQTPCVGTGHETGPGQDSAITTEDWLRNDRLAPGRYAVDFTDTTIDAAPLSRVAFTLTFASGG